MEVDSGLSDSSFHTINKLVMSYGMSKNTYTRRNNKFATVYICVGQYLVLLNDDWNTLHYTNSVEYKIITGNYPNNITSYGIVLAKTMLYALQASFLIIDFVFQVETTFFISLVWFYRRYCFRGVCILLWICKCDQGYQWFIQLIIALWQSVINYNILLWWNLGIRS